MALGAIKKGARPWAEPLAESEPNNALQADAFQRPLRFRFQARLTASVRLVRDLLWHRTSSCTVEAPTEIPRAGSNLSHKYDLAFRLR